MFPFHKFRGNPNLLTEPSRLRIAYMHVDYRPGITTVSHCYVVIANLVKKDAPSHLEIFYVMSMPGDPYHVDIVKRDFDDGFCLPLFSHLRTAT
jgi:hypothetical protein